MTDPDDFASLSAIRSETILWVVRAAIADGNAVEQVADWSKATVAHMRDGLSANLHRRVEDRFPDLTYYREDGTPHNAPDEGFTDGSCAVSFPRAR